VAKLVHHLRQGLYWNLGNLCNPALYGTALVGKASQIFGATLHKLADTN